MEALLDISATKKFIDPSLIQSVNVDTLIIFWGQNDKLIPVEHVNYFLRDIEAKKIVYDKCGHAPMIEIPHLIKDDVVKFWRVKY
ncbi:MAG: alpha/beta hydrolase [Bacteroidetes bacterium]|nr:alpha/beta hydrolase [Bacteroidota bacterium]